MIIEDGRAVSVQTVPTKPLHPNQLKPRIFKARKQIIVSGGTLSSPLILQRSGVGRCCFRQPLCAITDVRIGDPEKLKAAGVEPIVDLPGVGLNFQDHYLTFSAYRATPETESFDDFVRGEPEVQKRRLSFVSNCSGWH